MLNLDPPFLAVVILGGIAGVSILCGMLFGPVDRMIERYTGRGPRQWIDLPLDLEGILLIGALGVGLFFAFA